MEYDHLSLGKVFVVRHTEGSQVQAVTTKADEGLVKSHLTAIMDPLLKEQNQFLVSGSFTQHYKAVHRSFGKDLDTYERSLGPLLRFFDSHMQEINLSIPQMLVLELHAYPINEMLIDGTLVLIPGQESLILGKEGLSGQAILSVAATVSKPVLSILLHQGEALEDIIQVHVRGLAPYQMLYIKEKMIDARPLDNSYHLTSSVMNMSNAFIRDQLSPELMDKTERSELLQRTLDYFKEHDTFDDREFYREVMDAKISSEDFMSLMASLGKEDEEPLRFDISKEAVQKQGRIFKSVLKLDKNFHIYIHGNRKMIEKGQDEQGRKYYKLYYEKEY